MIASILDHLWQSSLFTVAAWLLVLTLRNNGAHARFWVWFAASVKFLVPFGLLAAAGAALSYRLPALQTLPLWNQASPHLLAMRPAAAPFLQPAPLAQGHDLTLWLLALWGAGVLVLLWSRLARAWRLHAVARAAHPMDLDAPVAVRSSASLMEPGLVGVWRPQVLLPAGLLARLSGAERDAILAHEFGHLRRRDNLTASVHMLVETLFWFHPLVWLIGGRLIAERERACDETVLAAGFDPAVYAGAILQVCRFCIRSPLACAPGASGSDLGRRIEGIMRADPVCILDGGRKLMLTGAAMLALGLPVGAGFVHSPLAVRMHRQVMTVQARAEEVLAQSVAVIAPSVAPRPRPSRRRREEAVTVPLPAVPLLPQPSLEAPKLQRAPLQAVQPPPAPDVPVAQALYPSGTGDPGKITCRTPQALPGSRLPGPETCRLNRDWALLRANGTDIAPDGQSIVATAEASGALTPRLCYVAIVLGGWTQAACF